MSTPPDDFSRADQAAHFVLARTSLRPRIAVVLGSGLGAFADELREPERVSYGDIPHFPTSTAVGHAGRLVIGKLGDIPLAVMQRMGRRPSGDLRVVFDLSRPIRAKELHRWAERPIRLPPGHRFWQHGGQRDTGQGGACAPRSARPGHRDRSRPWRRGSGRDRQSRYARKGRGARDRQGSRRGSTHSPA